MGFDLKIIKAGGYLLSFIRNKVNDYKCHDALFSIKLKRPNSDMN